MIILTVEDEWKNNDDKFLIHALPLLSACSSSLRCLSNLEQKEHISTFRPTKLQEVIFR